MTLTPDDPKLTAYALGELDATERAAVEAALARSPECRRAVAEIQALTGELTLELAREAATTPLLAVGRDSVEPHFERSEASAASISDAGEETRFARASSVGIEGSTESRPTDALPSLAPIGGEGRGEGASRDAQPNATARSSHQEVHASAATNEGTPPDSARLSPSPQPSPPVGARERSSAGAPGEGKVIFLPWRHWQTLGMAAAAALVVGFFVTKAWLPKPTEQMAKEDMSLPAARAKSVANWAQRPTNQVAHGSNQSVPLVFTNSSTTVIRTNGSSGVVTVNFATSDSFAVAGVDYIAQNGTLTFSEGDRRTAFSVPIAIAASSGQNVYYRSVVPRPADVGLVVAGVQNEYRITTQPGWGFQPDTTTTAAYPRYVENPFTLVASEPLSTFSTDVDTASYANVRRFLNQNQLPPRDAVRVEELLNYFTYDYAPPTGEHPFAAHIEIAGCPWAPEHRLVRVGLKGRELKADKRPPSNFVFLIDVSGSMSPVTRLPLIKQSLRQLVKRMTENDRVAMVVYASSSGTVLESTSAVNKELILAAIDRLEAGGSTNGGEGIQRAYDLAVANFIKGGVNRVLLCTDGDFNVGITDRGQLLKLIEEKAKSGVFLTTLGVGDDNFKDATLQQLADKGNGNYHYLDSVEEGHKVLVEQMNATLVTIAKDVKIQIEFNPSQASAYRLIGYEKRIMAKQDFNNDAKDAGEIGAGHTVTALYEVVPPGVQLRGDVDPLKYQTSSQPAATDSAIPTRPKSVRAQEWEEFTKARAQLEASIAELGKTYVPAHPKMQALYKQREALEKRLRDLTPSSKELLTLKLRYKAPDGDKSTLMEIPVTDSGAKLARASADFKFASAVASFGMALKDSPFKGTATIESAQELAQEGKGDDTHGYRAEFINLLAKAKALKQ